jgi:hypothetical protein
MQSSDDSNAVDTGPGVSVKDILPIPATDPSHADRNGQSTAAGDGPTFSHALAAEKKDNEGQAQQDHGENVLDLGWNGRKEDVAAPLVGGLDNDELWLLVRRFNRVRPRQDADERRFTDSHQQIYHVKANPYPPPGGLDLNIADDEEFSPDKMRANVERLYMTVGVGLLSACKHVARLRSWREPKRTAYFAATYFIAWLFDFLAPLLSAVFVALIGFPETREVLFPPAPVALVDSKAGGVQKPKAGFLGSHDSATGAPENHKGEAVEQEASNFVSGIASIALSSAAGKHPQGDPDAGENALADAAPDPTSLATRTADAKDKASGEKTGAKHDKTKVPMETAMWAKMRPIMHTIGTIADTWERLGKYIVSFPFPAGKQMLTTCSALSPIPLFPSEVYRLRLIAVLLPLVFGVSLFVTPYILLKFFSFLIGFIFFGDPILSRGLRWLNRTIPNWQKLLEPRKYVVP